jgi:hypothetical protein
VETPIASLEMPLIAPHRSSAVGSLASQCLGVDLLHSWSSNPATFANSRPFEGCFVSPFVLFGTYPVIPNRIFKSPSDKWRDFGVPSGARRESGAVISQ